MAMKRFIGGQRRVVERTVQDSASRPVPASFPSSNARAGECRSAFNVSPPMKICVVTSHDISEPRGVRHAIAAKRAFPNSEVTFLYYQSGSDFELQPILPILRQNGIACRVLIFPTRISAPLVWLLRKIVTNLTIKIYAITGFIHQGMFSERTINLTRILKNIPSDVFFAHNFETLKPAAVAAQHHGAALIFDCMEFYSDMGDSQRANLSEAIVEIEARYLPQCQLVFASSREVATAYAETYDIDLPLAVYNSASIIQELPERKRGALNLYWRNSVIGFGQRGLEDILTAMAKLPADVHLYLQGRLGHDSGVALRQRIAELDLGTKVSILPPHQLGDAVKSAAQFDVGLCLERKGPRNHDLTVSNKMLDYHMAGLAVIASDLPGLASVIKQSGGGLLYEPGNVEALFSAVEALRAEPNRLAQLQQNAREFALRDANMETEICRVAEALQARLAVSLHSSENCS